MSVDDVSAVNDDCIGQADGSLMLPVVLRLSLTEGISAGLFIPQVGKVQLGVPQ